MSPQPQACSSKINADLAMIRQNTKKGIGKVGTAGGGGGGGEGMRSFGGGGAQGLA